MTVQPTPTLPPSTLSFPPICPTVAFPPTKIATDTWVIHQVQRALGQPLDVYLNSMVILGAEPVIVLGHWAWRVLFGADSSIIDRRVPMNAGFVRVVGRRNSTRRPARTRPSVANPCASWITARARHPVAGTG